MLLNCSYTWRTNADTAENTYVHHRWYCWTSYVLSLIIYHHRYGGRSLSDKEKDCFHWARVDNNLQYGYTNITSDVPKPYECKAADKFCYKINLKTNKTTEVMGLSYRLSNSISND